MSYRNFGHVGRRHVHHSQVSCPVAVERSARPAKEENRMGAIKRAVMSGVMCAGCGSLIKGKVAGHQIFCSDACANEAWLS
jgi:hypothetical protein